jgi:hypothetical protein
MIQQLREEVGRYEAAEVTHWYQVQKANGY